MSVSDLFVALIHHPVVNRNGEIVTSAITSLDIHDIAVQAIPGDLPPPGEVDHVEVDIQYFNFLSPAAYDAINAIYTVTTDPSDGDDDLPISEIQAQDDEGNTFTYLGGAPDPNDPNDPDNDGSILPSGSSELLGAPEPTMLGPLAAMALISLRKRH